MHDDTLETIEHESGQYRVRIVPDYEADPGDCDGMAFVLVLDDRRERVEQLHGKDSGLTVPDVAGALLHFRQDLDLFGRYLRMFYDVASFDYWTPRDGTVVAFTTRELARAWGFTDPDDDDKTYHHGESRRDIVARSAPDALHQWRQRDEGDVYGYVVEQHVTWRPVSVPADEDVTMETWEHIDSCYGFFGHEYAEQEARSALASATAKVNDE